MESIARHRFWHKKLQLQQKGFRVSDLKFSDFRVKDPRSTSSWTKIRFLDRLAEIDRKVGRQQYIFIDFVSKKLICQRKSHCFSAHTLAVLTYERVLVVGVLALLPRWFLMSWDRKVEKNNKTSSKTLTKNSKRKSKDKLLTQISSKS